MAEASQPGETVAEVAWRHDLDGRRVSSWMKKFVSEAALMAVEVMRDVGISAKLEAPPSTCVE